MGGGFERPSSGLTTHVRHNFSTFTSYFTLSFDAPFPFQHIPRFPVFQSQIVTLNTIRMTSLFQRRRPQHTKTVHVHQRLETMRPEQLQLTQNEDRAKRTTDNVTLQLWETDSCDVLFHIVDVHTEDVTPLYAHRLILACRSPVFAAMFFSDFAEQGDAKPLIITGCQTEYFRLMILSMYYDAVDVPEEAVLELCKCGVVVVWWYVVLLLPPLSSHKTCLFSLT